MGYATDVVQALFEQAPGAILISRRSGTIVDANPGALRLLGDRLIGREIEQVLSGRFEVARRDIGELVVTFVRDVAELQRARIAHDFKNVLSVILARCELLAG